MIDDKELARREALNASGQWDISDNIDTTDFDFAWRPYKYDRPQIHQFGTQHQRTGGPRFVVPEAEGTVFVDTQRAQALPQPEKFIVEEIEGATVEFDYSWHPDAFEPPFVWAFGPEAGGTAEEHTVIKYIAQGATEHSPVKYCNDIRAILKSIKTREWNILIPINEDSFDFGWRPHEHEPPYIHVFGNKWNDAGTEPTIEYRVPGATERKYHIEPVAELLVDTERWTIVDESDRVTFDFTWRPNPHSSPQIYQWENNGPIYTPPNASETTPVVLMERLGWNYLVAINKYYITTTLEELINEHPNEVFWALNPDLNYDQFDYSWHPDPTNFKHINVFGSEYSKDTQTYYINGPAYVLGHREYNYIENYFQTFTELDMFYVVRGDMNDTRFDQLLQRFPRLQKTRYLNNWITTISRCLRKATTPYVWILSSDLDYTDFEFDFFPSKWQTGMLHIFGTQWSHWGNTYFVNKETFAQQTEYIDRIEHTRNINHVRKKRARLVDNHYDIVYIDHGNASDSLEQLKQHSDNITVVKYESSYLDTLKAWANGLSEWDIKQEHLVWVCSSVCDYSRFDFTWASDPFQREQIHVVASEDGNTKQLQGDTFLINVNSFREDNSECYDLAKYEKKINYVNYLHVDRLQCPVIAHGHDSQAQAIGSSHLTNKERTEGWPYFELVQYTDTAAEYTPVVPSLWDEYTSSIVVPSRGASRIVVPRVAINYVNDEVYDYKHILVPEHQDNSRPLDILFISNGEPVAEENYELLVEHAKQKNLPNRIARVKDVNGRVASQRAAADTAETSWYFFMNGKIRINEDFDFSWQPDRLQQPKHYIFTAFNPVNYLVYGHQAIVANNRQLTYTTRGRGLDFTMESLHAVVDMNCGTAVYNTDPWTTWRTAFREAVKLRCDMDPVSRERLDAWLNIGNGENGEWSTAGAQDAVEYWETVVGDWEQLRLSYDWAWLKEYYEQKYG